MDPNANLQEQERILSRKRTEGFLPGDRSRLHDLRDALRVWLMNGGFSPDWTLCPLAKKYYGR